jgi:hypothetical protein
MVAQCRRLVHGDAKGLRAVFDGRRGEFAAAAGRAVGLGQYKCDVDPGRGERLE